MNAILFILTWPLKKIWRWYTGAPFDGAVAIEPDDVEPEAEAKDA